jgi:hypothetical protein
MTAMTNYLEAKLLDHVFRSVTYTPPSVVYLALFTALPDDSGGGTEVTGGSYARQGVTFAAAVSPDGRVSNSASVLFSNMPACTVVGGGYVDAISGGNLLMYGPLAMPRVVVAGDNITVAIGDLNVYFD